VSLWRSQLRADSQRRWPPAASLNSQYAARCVSEPLQLKRLSPTAKSLTKSGKEKQENTSALLRLTFVCAFVNVAIALKKRRRAGPWLVRNTRSPNPGSNAPGLKKLSENCGGIHCSTTRLPLRSAFSFLVEGGDWKTGRGLKLGSFSSCPHNVLCYYCRLNRQPKAVIVSPLITLRKGNRVAFDSIFLFKYPYREYSNVNHKLVRTY